MSDEYQQVLDEQFERDYTSTYLSIFLILGLIASGGYLLMGGILLIWFFVFLLSLAFAAGILCPPRWIW